MKASDLITTVELLIAQYGDMYLVAGNSDPKAPSPNTMLSSAIVLAVSELPTAKPGDMFLIVTGLTGEDYTGFNSFCTIDESTVASSKRLYSAPEIVQ